MKKCGRPIWWLAVVVAVGMAMMTAGVAQAGPIKWMGEGFGPWKLGDPDDGPDVARRVLPPYGPGSELHFSVSQLIYRVFFVRSVPVSQTKVRNQ